MTGSMIEVEGVVKRFGPTVALAGVDLTAEQGKVLGLLGPNGAGKTTLVRILTTLLRPDAGTARVAGYDVVADAGPLRSSIGLAGQYAAVDELLTGRENLELVGLWYHLRRVEYRRRAEELLERFALTDAADRLVKGYSGGMRRRLDVAASLVANPPVLFLDEPTTGLDPRTRNDLWRFIEELVVFRDDRPAHDAVHGRGRTPRQPDRRDRYRQGHRTRYRPRTERQDGWRRARSAGP